MRKEIMIIDYNCNTDSGIIDISNNKYNAIGVYHSIQLRTEGYLEHLNIEDVADNINKGLIELVYLGNRLYKAVDIDKVEVGTCLNGLNLNNNKMIVYLHNDGIISKEWNRVRDRLKEKGVKYVLEYISEYNKGNYYITNFIPSIGCAYLTNKEEVIKKSVYWCLLHKNEIINTITFDENNNRASVSFDKEYNFDCTQLVKMKRIYDAENRLKIMRIKNKVAGCNVDYDVNYSGIVKGIYVKRCDPTNLHIQIPSNKDVRALKDNCLFLGRCYGNINIDIPKNIVRVGNFIEFFVQNKYTDYKCVDKITINCKTDSVSVQSTLIKLAHKWCGYAKDIDIKFYSSKSLDLVRNVRCSNGISIRFEDNAFCNISVSDIEKFISKGNKIAVDKPLKYSGRIVIIREFDKEYFRAFSEDIELEYKTVKNIVNKMKPSKEVDYLKKLVEDYYVYLENTVHMYYDFISDVGVIETRSFIGANITRILSGIDNKKYDICLNLSKEWVENLYGNNDTIRLMNMNCHLLYIEYKGLYDRLRKLNIDFKSNTDFDIDEKLRKCIDEHTSIEQLFDKKNIPIDFLKICINDGILPIRIDKTNKYVDVKIRVK